jgi:hypothetical protein
VPLVNLVPRIYPSVILCLIGSIVTIKRVHIALEINLRGYRLYVRGVAFVWRHELALLFTLLLRRTLPHSLLTLALGRELGGSGLSFFRPPTRLRKLPLARLPMTLAATLPGIEPRLYAARPPLLFAFIFRLIFGLDLIAFLSAFIAGSLVPFIFLIVAIAQVL